MIHTTVTCDRCQAEIDAGHRFHLVLYGIDRTGASDFDGSRNQSYDLCDSCSEGILGFLTP